MHSSHLAVSTKHTIDTIDDCLFPSLAVHVSFTGRLARSEHPPHKTQLKSQSLLSDELASQLAVLRDHSTYHGRQYSTQCAGQLPEAVLSPVKLIHDAKVNC